MNGIVELAMHLSGISNVASLKVYQSIRPGTYGPAYVGSNIETRMAWVKFTSPFRR